MSQTRFQRCDIQWRFQQRCEPPPNLIRRKPPRASLKPHSRRNQSAVPTASLRAAPASQATRPQPAMRRSREDPSRGGAATPLTERAGGLKPGGKVPSHLVALAPPPPPREKRRPGAPRGAEAEAAPPSRPSPSASEQPAPPPPSLSPPAGVQRRYW